MHGGGIAGAKGETHEEQAGAQGHDAHDDVGNGGVKEGSEFAAGYGNGLAHAGVRLKRRSGGLVLFGGNLDEELLEAGLLITHLADGPACGSDGAAKGGAHVQAAVGSNDGTAPAVDG